MPPLVEESTRVGAPPDAIWKLLSEPKSWRFWWPHCKAAESADRRPLHDGSGFVYVIEKGLFPASRQATVDVAQPNRALLWVERSGGVVRRHAFYLEVGTSSTLVRARATFEGWGVPIFLLLHGHLATSAMFREALKGLRRMAERGA